MSSDQTQPEAVAEDDLDAAQGGNLFNPWPVSFKARDDKNAVLFFDEADAVRAPSPNVVFEPNDEK